MSEKPTFIEISLCPVRQHNNMFYSGVVDVKHIKDLFTISPAQYQLANLKTNRSIDIEDYDQYMAKLKDNIDYGYQRNIINEEKINKISKYISSEDDYHIIPNSIIFSINTEIMSAVDFDHMIDKAIEEFDPMAFYIKKLSDNSMKLLIPETLITAAKINDYKKLLVIDGHHRLRGIVRYLDEHLESGYQIIGSFLINRDAVDEAEIFTTVNYEIKPVNKSYYYHIMGEFGIGKKEFIYLHYLIRIFNESKDSPLYGRIKMLGRSDTSTVRKQTISQSFLVEQIYAWTLQELKSPNKKYALKRMPVLRHFLMTDNEEIATKIITRYFLAIKECFNKYYKKIGLSWDDDGNQLLKTVGLGALIEVLPAIYILIITEKNYLNSQDKLIEIKSKDFDKYLINIFNDKYDALERLKSNFSKGSSQGFVKAFATELWEAIIPSDYHIKENAYLDWLINK
jgi:DGQHR domain-containing protein